MRVSLVVVLALAGCSDPNPRVATAVEPVADLSGVWGGRWAGGGQSGPATALLDQRSGSRLSVSGPMNLPAPGPGQLELDGLFFRNAEVRLRDVRTAIVFDLRVVAEDRLSGTFGGGWQGVLELERVSGPPARSEPALLIDHRGRVWRGVLEAR